MRVATRGLTSLLIVVAVAVVASRLFAAAVSDSSFDLSCGANGSNASGTVVIQLTDSGTLQHGRLTVAGGRDPDARFMTIVSNVAGRESMCGALEGGHFQMRGTTARLNRTTLHITANHAVPVELRDLSGTVLHQVVLNPASGKDIALTW